MYFVIEVSKVNDQYIKVVTEKENYNEALMLFHQIRSSQFANVNVKYGMAMVTDEVGYVSAKEHHIVPELGSEQELQDEIQNGE